MSPSIYYDAREENWRLTYTSKNDGSRQSLTLAAKTQETALTEAGRLLGMAESAIRVAHDDYHEPSSMD